METLSLELLKKHLSNLLHREVGIEKLKSGKFMCKYLDYGMSPLALVGATEEEAYQKLAAYLKAKQGEPFNGAPVA